MSSNTEQGSSIDPKAEHLKKATEAAKNYFLRKLAEKAPSPRQAAIVCEILNLPEEELKQVKSLAWLKKYEPDMYQSVLNASEAKNKDQERKKMKIVWGKTHKQKEVELIAKRYADRLRDKFRKIIAKRSLLLEVETMEVPDSINCIVGVYPMGAQKGLCLDTTQCGWIPHEAKIWAQFWYSHGYDDLKNGEFTVTIHVKEKGLLNLAKSVARRYEKSRKKDCVAIHKEY